MERIGHLFSIKVSPLDIGIILVTFIVLGIILYMKKRNANTSRSLIAASPSI